MMTGSTIGSVSDNVTYNSFGELQRYHARFSGSTVYSVDYDSRDKLGRIVTKTETVNGETHTYRYVYDPNTDELTDVYKDGALVSHYDYDDNGNRVRYTGTDGTFIGTYDAQDRMLSYGGNTYQYTANGELAKKINTEGTTVYDYDVLGNLRAVTLPDGTKIEYVIDGLNRRIMKKVNGILVQGFLYQDQLNPVAELDGSGNVVSRFVYANGINVPDYSIKGGVTYRIITDHLGSPRVIINVATGEIVQRMDYDEYGTVILDTNPGFQPFGFAGGLYDKDTGLVRFGARDYDAETGRWTAKDPIGFDGMGPNLFSYVGNEPVNWNDPSGLTKNDPWYGHNEKNFQNWYHRRWKQKGGPRVRSKEEIDEAYDDWVAEGKPSPDNKGKNKGKGKNKCEWIPNVPVRVPQVKPQHAVTATVIVIGTAILVFTAKYGWILLFV
jgi:RHS repeat-associated protein